MRTIKFRAWSNNVKQMLHWPQIINDPDNWLQSLFQGLDSNDVLMQFTGLYDKNGKEIYEGDIVKTSDGRTTKVDDPILGNFIYLEIKEMGLQPKDMEVIGNIYENPELIK